MRKRDRSKGYKTVSVFFTDFGVKIVGHLSCGGRFQGSGKIGLLSADAQNLDPDTRAVQHFEALIQGHPSPRGLAGMARVLAKAAKAANILFPGNSVRVRRFAW